MRLVAAEQVGRFVQEREQRQDETDAADNQETEEEVDGAEDDSALEGIGDNRIHGHLAATKLVRLCVVFMFSPPRPGAPAGCRPRSPYRRRRPGSDPSRGRSAGSSNQPIYRFFKKLLVSFLSFRHAHSTLG